MKTTAYLLLSAGLILLLVLVAHYGFAEIGAAVTAAGWGLLLITLFHLAPMVADTLAWRYLIEPVQRPRLLTLLWMRWIGESVNSLLPAAQVAGDLVRARLAAQHGVPAASAAASIVVDLTLSILTLILFCLIGVILLLLRDTAAQGLISVLVGVATTAVLLFFFYLLQRRGLFQHAARTLARMAKGQPWGKLVTSAATLDQAIAAIYRRRRAILMSGSWALGAWVLGAGEIWLALYFLGTPLGFAEALILESLIQAIRSAAFPVPGALGIQEGGFLLIGAMLGIAPELALAVSLIKRVRELLLGLPGLLTWHFIESRRLLRHGLQP